MSDMIERVAKAILRFNLEGICGVHEDAVWAAERETYIGAAKAALEAMREPTEAMCEASTDVFVGASGERGEENNYCPEWAAKDVWKAMIGEALRPVEKGV